MQTHFSAFSSNSCSILIRWSYGFETKSLISLLNSTNVQDNLSRPLLPPSINSLTTSLKIVNFDVELCGDVLDSSSVDVIEWNDKGVDVCRCSWAVVTGWLALSLSKSALLAKTFVSIEEPLIKKNPFKKSKCHSSRSYYDWLLILRLFQSTVVYKLPKLLCKRHVYRDYSYETSLNACLNNKFLKMMI